MNRQQALEEAILYLAGALDAGQYRSGTRHVTGGGLRALVEWTRGLSGDVPIAEVWQRAQGALDDTGPQDV